MKPPELLAALGPVVDAFEALEVRYYVGGSVASSAHGAARASIDVDVVADLGLEHVHPLMERLAAEYYVDEGRARAALDRARPQGLEEEPEPRRFSVASAEDTILAKLEWFRAGGEVSERQWSDVVGVLRTVGTSADQPYLRQWAVALGVADLMERALAEAGFP